VIGNQAQGALSFSNLTKSYVTFTGEHLILLAISQKGDWTTVKKNWECNIS